MTPPSDAAATYEGLLEALKRERALPWPDSMVEDRILEEMDTLWWQMTDDERARLGRQLP